MLYWIKVRTTCCPGEHADTFGMQHLLCCSCSMTRGLSLGRRYQAVINAHGGHAHFMSVLTHSDKVFLGLPLLRVLGILILVMEFMHEEERATYPYHLKRLVRRAAVTSCTPNIAQSVSADTSSSSLDSAYPVDH